MHIGMQIEAPEGFREMVRGQRYYFMRSDTATGLVTLIFFPSQRGHYAVQILRLQRDAFEQGLGGPKKLIVPCKEQFLLPPWLPQVHPAEFERIDSRRAMDANRYRTYVEARFCHIAPLVEEADEILASDDPFKCINVHAANVSPPQNTVRMRLWFFAYICHGREIWALMRCEHNKGLWDRGSELHGQKRHGATGTQGRNHGHSAVLLRQRIIDAYVKYCALGRTLIEIYQEAMRKDFGCKSVDVNGQLVMTHPQGLPFPSYGPRRPPKVPHLWPLKLLHLAGVN